MHIRFDSRHEEVAALRPWAEQRVKFTLRRWTAGVSHAAVRLSDVNGPRGGRDKRCQVELSTEGGGSVVVTSVASHWRQALSLALSRAVQALLRRWKRQQHQRRSKSVTPETST